jgi:hypothetical protein
MKTLGPIRQEIYAKLIKECDALAYEFQEDAETWRARMNGSTLKSVYDPEEQAERSAFAASIYTKISQTLKRALDT